MAAPARSYTFDHVMSTTMDHYYRSGVLHDAIFNSNPTFAELFKKGLNKQVQGGGKIIANLMYEGNGTVAAYSGYDQFDTAPQDGISSAQYDWSQYGATITIDNLSVFKNSGKAQIVSMMREKAQQLSMSFSEEMNKDLWDIEGPAAEADGTNGKKILGIPLYVQGDPTGGLDVGGIDQSVYTWWANQTSNSGTESTGTFIMLNGELMRLFHNCSKGPGGSPNLIISDLGTYECYVKGMDTKTRYVYTNTPSIGFTGVEFFGAKWFWDYHVGDPDGGYNFDNASYSLDSGGAVYMLNTKFLELVVGKNKDFKPSPFEEPYDRDARVSKAVFYGQLVCSNRKKLGVLEDITTTLTS